MFKLEIEPTTSVNLKKTHISHLSTLELRNVCFGEYKENGFLESGCCYRYVS
jgi:hypothetical protein